MSEYSRTHTEKNRARRRFVRESEYGGTGLVYFIAEPPGATSGFNHLHKRATIKSFVKVGYCSDYDRLVSRLVDLQVGNPRPLTVVAVVERVNMDFEALVHHAWRQYRAVGEWFIVTETFLNSLLGGHVTGVPWAKTRPMRSGAA